MNAVCAETWKPTEQGTVNDVLRRAVHTYGDRMFLEFLGDEYSFIDVNDHACRLANGLKALGVKHGDTVVTILDTSPDAVFIWLAINKLGAISVPVNTALKGEFLRHQLSDADAAVVLAEHDYAERVAAVADRLPSLRTLVYRGAKPSLGQLRADVLPWAEIVSDDKTDQDVVVKPTDLAMLVYTGGTTGPSKGCMLSHNYTYVFCQQMLKMTNRNSETHTWTPLPLFHMNSICSTVMVNLIVGARVSLYPRFSVSNFWPEIERTKATEVSILGAMFPMLANAPDNEAMKRCKGQLNAAWGAPFPAEIQQVWKDRFGLRYTASGCFGLTECSLMTVLPFGTPAKPGSSGMRNEWFDVRIVDENENELPANTPGELIVRPRMPNIMFDGYWRRPEETLKVMKNLWFHTGDIGRFDEEGYFFFVDRKKDYLRRRGENISSFEVENAFRAHEAIEDVAAHAVLDTLGEDELKVTIVLRDGAQLTEEALCRWAIDQLPYYAVPRYIEFRTALPRSPVGKVQKYELRDQGVTPGTWDREKSDIVLIKR
ncbi:AMP-binding protein [Pandoraea fibrosis]|uniref:ATP-dependent acyl-CoA ligase n=3 Tax=Burkholderiaceae TaxID=119060 RepID=A0AAW7MH93_9BURK|nr:ATP-dependent acyl-CoA ligase [Pandoraea apista]MDN4572103.1 ATP-dependent acyl-CoA ligase [Pandoraea cepalis]QHE94804.1 AMP-binding protein [Pandoraea fibrosis]MDN4576759.1 ATP-dependent acyl-CoA ligase [Pandoraea cepalis]QHF15922.1 AMP-binding protein [Pandoraea fibrosis]